MRISIKRRLLISNILMVVIPLLLTTILVAGATIFFLGGSIPDFFSMIHTVPIEQNQVPDLDFSNIEFPISDSVLVYQLDNGNHVLVLPEEMNSRFAGIDSSAEQMSLDVVVVSNYLVDQVLFFEDNQVLINVITLILLASLTLLVNISLVKFVFKPIITSLNILAEGVHEISDGNLAYRLKHDMGNEFDAIGDNFNQMASQLSRMVEQRKMDEQNRKELIAGIAHDLRTPLTSIRTYAEGLEMGMATTPEMHTKYLSTIKSKTGDMEHILNQLFLFSKLDLGEFPMRLDKWDAGIWLTDFIGNIRDEYSKKGLSIELDQQIMNTHFLIDSVQLGNVLTNVLENSVKYGRADEPQMTIYCEQNDAQIMIRMTDNGAGIASDALDQIFDAFYRSDKARTNPSSGSGLGLAISAKIIERMGGSIHAENAQAGGLTIIIKLPVVGGDYNEKNFNY